jgi:flagellar biosynthetic protein FliQ
MNLDQAVEIVRDAMMVALVVSAPILAVGLLVGLAVSIMQAVTQIQEQTLSFIPKILAMAITAIAIIPWAGIKLIEFSQRMFNP